MADQVKDLQIGDRIAMELFPGDWVFGIVEEIGIDATTGMHWSDVLLHPEIGDSEEKQIIRILDEMEPSGAHSDA